MHSYPSQQWCYSCCSRFCLPALCNHVCLLVLNVVVSTSTLPSVFDLHFFFQDCWSSRCWNLQKGILDTQPYRPAPVDCCSMEYLIMDYHGLLCQARPAISCTHLLRCRNSAGVKKSYVSVCIRNKKDWWADFHSWVTVVYFYPCLNVFRLSEVLFFGFDFSWSCRYMHKFTHKHTQSTWYCF